MSAQTDYEDGVTDGKRVAMIAHVGSTFLSVTLHRELDYPKPGPYEIGFRVGYAEMKRKGF